MLSQLTRYGAGFESGMLFPASRVDLAVMLDSCGYQEIHNSYSWFGHGHGEAARAILQYTVDGEGLLEYEGRSQRMAAGQLMIVCYPHDYHYFLPDDSDNWHFIYSVLRGTEAIRLMRQIIQRRGPLIDLNDDSIVVQQMVGILDALFDGKIISPFRASTLAYNLCMDVTEELISETTFRPKPVWLTRTLDFVEQHFAEDITAKELAQVAGYSRYHFSRVFKSEVGVSPIEYLITHRINRCVEMLQRSNLTVKEVCYAVGFRDYSYFCRLFRKRLGVPPGAFRKLPFADTRVHPVINSEQTVEA